MTTPAPTSTTEQAVRLPDRPIEEVHWLGLFDENPREMRSAGRHHVIRFEPFVLQVMLDGVTYTAYVLARRDITREQTAKAKREAEAAGMERAIALHRARGRHV